MTTPDSLTHTKLDTRTRRFIKAATRAKLALAGLPAGWTIDSAGLAELAGDGVSSAVASTVLRYALDRGYVKRGMSWGFVTVDTHRLLERYRRK